MAIVCRHKADIDIQDNIDLDAKEEEVIICNICSNVVTRPFHRVEVNNAFSHAFANPHGHVFEIGCFIKAEGCAAVLDPSAEFTWFPGYSWEMGACTGCAAHLGWIFSLDRLCFDRLKRFYGLILDRLIFP